MHSGLPVAIENGVVCRTDERILHLPTLAYNPVGCIIHGFSVSIFSQMFGEKFYFLVSVTSAK